MKKLLIAGVMAALAAGAFAQGSKTLNGAGATFPYPIYAKWSYEYKNISGVGLNYQSIGSGGGIQQINNRTVDFGASDAPVKDAELAQRGQLQFPTVMGGVVPIVNLEGVASNQIRMTPEVLADIFLGKITQWNDPRIAGLNAGAKLPARDIVVVHRADGSGTTWIFTNYLSKVSKEWKDKVGNDKAVSWPVGLGGKGNEGVAAYVKQVNGGIGYVEYAYAKQNDLTTVQLKNRDGQYVLPNMATFQAAAAGADWKNTPNYAVILTDQPGKDTWPIVGATWILLYKDQGDADRAQTMLKFFDWSLRKGGKLAEEMDYCPLPASVIDQISQTWASEVKCKGKPVWNPSMQVK
jgi:phosphate transport system substrate-binding protein